MDLVYRLFSWVRHQPEHHASRIGRVARTLEAHHSGTLLKSRGVLRKVELVGESPQVTVAPQFYLMDYDDKMGLAQILYLYARTEIGRFDVLLFRDSLRGSSETKPQKINYLATT